MATFQQQNNPEQQQQQWQPTHNPDKTRQLIKVYQHNPRAFSEQDLESIRTHAMYHNIPFYEGDFSILNTLWQAGGGLIEGFTTIRVADPPENSAESIARSMGSLVGFVPGILSGPLKALGLVNAAAKLSRVKSIPMAGAKLITGAVKKNVVKPILKNSLDSRFGAVNTASKFMWGEKAKHITEGAFELGAASAISSVWDGVDQMMSSFVHGAAAGGAFRGIGNLIPGGPKALTTEKGDKWLRALAGSMFMGLQAEQRGATTPEKIYEYLLGAYFGGQEMPWSRAKAFKEFKKFNKAMKDDVKLEIEKQVKDWERFEKLHPDVQKELEKISTESHGTRESNLAQADRLMKEMNIYDQIPPEQINTKGYKLLSNNLKAIRKNLQKTTKFKAHPIFGVATSGGAKGADSLWSVELQKKGMGTIHYMFNEQVSGFFKKLKTGQIKGVDREVGNQMLLEAMPAVEKANRTLNRPIKNDFVRKLFLRNYYQIKHADGVFAVGEIERSKTGEQSYLNGASVKGGTGWGVQMAIDKGLSKVYVYDPKQQGWFKWNSDVNRFTAILETPRLTTNPATIGARTVKRGSAGHKAIQDVANLTFGEIKEGAPTKVKKAISQEDVVERHKKTREKLKEQEGFKQDLMDELADINKALKNKKLKKYAIKRLKKSRQKLTQEIAKLELDIAENKALKSNQYIDYETGEIVNALDTGMKGQDFPLMKKSEFFSNSFLDAIWDIKGEEVITKRDNMIRMGKEVEEVIRSYIKKGDKNVKHEEAIKDIEKLYSTKGKKFELSSDGKRYIRRWLTELNLGEQIIFVKTRGGKFLEFTDPQNPTSLSGHMIRQVEAPKIMSEVFKAEGGKYEKAGEVNTPLVVFDSVTRTNKKGMSIDVPLENLLNHIRYAEGKYPIGEKKAKKRVKEIKGRIISQLAKDHNLYPVGGQGDKGRIVFAKFHPKGRKPSEYRKVYLDLVKVLRTRKIDGKYTDKDALSQLNRDRDMMKKFYGIKESDFKKMVASNVLYDLSMNGFKTDPGSITKNLKLLMGEGYISSALAYNKRAQIWFTGGYGGNKKFIATMVDDLSPDGNLKYALIADPKKLKGKTSLEALNIELPEHVDGAIITRDGYVDAANADAGAPKSGQNKSFIVSPGDGVKHGALLGKYMMHKAGPELSKAMREANNGEGIHMLIMTSSAKQTGGRKAGDYDKGPNGELILKNAPIYELNPEHVKYNSSVVSSKHMIQKQMWVKQLFTNLQQFGHAPIDKRVIDDIYTEVIHKNYVGKENVNKELDNYLNTLDSSKLDFLLKNLENIGTPQLIQALKKPGAERFAEAAMQRMLRVVEKDIESQFQSGEITLQERGQMLAEFKESISPIDRLLKNVAIVGEEAAAQGMPGFSGYMHKYVRDYRNSVLHNYFVKSVTRPVIENSAAARMRPYDKWMQAKFPELNNDKLAMKKHGVKSDELFYLDEAYKDTKIMWRNKEATLGDIWALYGEYQKNFSKNRERLKELEDIFDAVVLRVPMDSISGAHKLRFAGFTGTDGHGIMLHSRSMRALGGADLDGDEAFIYFGGKKEDGTGHGMKKSWKDAIHSNKEEFYTGKEKSRDIKDAKEDFRDLLTVSGNDALKEKKALYYSPYSRLEASDGAVDGRSRMGIAVSQGQVMKSTYNALMEAEGRKDVYTVRRKEKEYIGKKDSKGKQRFKWVWNTYEITRTPKTGKAAQKYQRELTRAQIAFASDPLDEGGLVSNKVFFTTLHDAHFNISKIRKKTGKGKWKDVKVFDELRQSELKGGTYGIFRDMNRAYFGRNYEEGRNFTIDEMNLLASGIGKLTEAQKNTILPKMVEKLEGLDWTDNLFNRINKKAISDIYKEINAMDKDVKFAFLKPLMQRSSFTVPYNKHIEAVLENNLDNRHIRREIAYNAHIYNKAGIARFNNVLKGIAYGEKLQYYINKQNGNKKWLTYKERMKILDQIYHQGQDFMANDLADMATILNLKRLMEAHKFDPKMISKIHNKTELFKARSYLNIKERRKINYDAYLGDPAEKEIVDIMTRFDAEMKGKKIKQLDLAGDKRSAAWDQAKLDMEIIKYKKKLTLPEQELFDHLMIGTLNRGDLTLANNIIKSIPKEMYSPQLNDLITKLMHTAAGTKQSRLAYNSEAISDIAIQNHIRAMNNAYSKMQKAPSKEEIKKTQDEYNKVLNESPYGEVKIVDEMVQGAHAGEGYAGIKPGELTAKDTKVITDIAVILKRYNNKMQDIPALNEQMGGILFEATGKAKDLNTFTKGDFQIVLNYLKMVEGGSIMQKIFKSDKPEIQRRYWSLFPETINRQLMKDDILWLKENGYFLTKSGETKLKAMRRPTYFLDVLQQWVHRANTLATGESERISKDLNDTFINLTELKDGNALFRIASAQRELGLEKTGAIDLLESSPELKQHWKDNYKRHWADIDKRHNWKRLKDKKYTLTNDAGQRVTATGFEIVNGSKSKELTGVKEKITKYLSDMYTLIEGKEGSLERYRTGEFFNNDSTKPIMNWELFVKDVVKAFEKGKTINMDIGIDGMRHILRSMMVSLDKKHAEAYINKDIVKTGKMAPEVYWPHMFHSRKEAEISMRQAIEDIMKSNKSPEEKRRAIEKIAVRHKTMTGDWEFVDIDEWDKIEQQEVESAWKDIAKKKSERDQKIHWVNMDPTAGPLHKRTGHVAGWSSDVNVLHAYGKQVTSTYYKQLTQIMSRKTMDEAYHRMHSKFGHRLANNWNTFFKLYVQGAMGQPDVIPEAVYNNREMKLKGTPYASWADSNVLKRLNQIRRMFAFKSDLPPELKDFTYRDIRNWSNLEAQYELATLLAHPKSSITNLWGGTLHTIQSAGPGALLKARDIKYLKRINPEWNSLKDVEEFAIKHGVVPEFMIHELGLGKEAKGATSIREFIGDLTHKINAKDPIERKEIFALGKKHGLMDEVIAKAAKFMSVPEVALRRDSFMAHYIRAWENYSGAIKDPNHPFLIEQAKKGVKATQFLYEAPFRPMFARTALGKVMSRFQLFAWNSWRFRNDVHRQAKIYGYKPGSEGMKKFERMMQIDLFVLALANIFQYSLFDNALPQPYGWLQDTSEWLFGDEKARNRSFYGQWPAAVAPLQMITPPIARGPLSAISAFATNDLKRFTEYHAWSLFPFGRMARDLAQPGKGLIDNPSRFMEKVAGMPVRQTQRYIREKKKAEEEGSRYKAPKIKVGF